MTVVVETLEGLQRSITLNLAPESVQKEKQKRLQNLSRKVRLDGYRPGKVPFKIVERNYGDQVEHETISDLLNEQYRDFYSKTELKIASAPNISAKADGGDYEFIATFEVMPDFSLTGLDGIVVAQPKAEVTEEDIDAMLETLCKQRTQWQPVTRAAAVGDRVSIDFEGTIDGETFEGGAGKAAPVVIGSGGMIPGFEEALTGAKETETRTFDVTFPSDYHAQALQGKLATFTATVLAVSEPIMPVVDDQFAVEFGVKEGGVAQLRTELRRNMERELASAIQNQVKKQVMDGLLAANPIDVPQALINAEVETLASQSRLPKAKNKEQAQQLMMLAQQAFGEEAKRRAALGLLFSKIVTEHDVKVDEQRIEARLQTLASTYEDPEDVIKWYRNDKNAMQSLRGLALEDELIDLLLSKAKVSDEASSFNAIMNPQAAA